MSDDDLPRLIENSSKNPIEDGCDNDSDEEQWPEENQDAEPTVCLFCSEKFRSIEEALEHLKRAYGFDLCILKTKFNMDQYSYIKMINYIRKNSSKPEEFVTASKAFWSDEINLKPIGFEPWLMFDFEDLIPSEPVKGVDCTFDQYLDLEIQVDVLKNKIKERDELLKQAHTDIEKLREGFRVVIEDEDKKLARRPPQSVSDLEFNEDEAYFHSYAHYDIHHEMLSDRVRTISYRDAIQRNTDTIRDKIVMDLGCGTSILSMFASKAGASRVIAVDNSEIIYQAMDIVNANKITNITFIKGKIEEIEMPVEKVDVIVSEWMGYFLLFEGMLDSVIYARNKYLKSDGVLLPNRCNISILGYGDEERHQKYVGFWKDVFGFDMSAMQKELLREGVIEVCKPEFVLTEPNVIAEFDLMTVDVSCPNFSYDFTLPVLKDGRLTSLVGYFDTFFEMKQHPVEFSTSPMATTTHWKQVVFYMREPVEVKKGQVVSGKFKCWRNTKEVRCLVIRVEMFDQIMDYNMS